MTDLTNPIERLRASLADEPEAWSPTLRLLGEALLTLADRGKPVTIPPGSVVEHEMTAGGITVTVRLADGTGWHCEGDHHLVTDCDYDEAGWDWDERGFDDSTAVILASGLTAEECIQVAVMTEEQARVWCIERAARS